ncbi:MAG: Rieske 2Fe-2S domain-containing protein [Phycisphaeraceae bacterium]
MLPLDQYEESKMPDGRPREAQPKWRQDFPVDVAQDEYVARRDFVKFLVLTSFAFTIGQFWIVVQNRLRQRRGKPPMTRIAAVADVPVGAALSFNYPGAHDPCVLVRTDEQTYLAYGQKCTHLSCAVLPRVSERSFRCPCHEGHFDMMTGQPTAGPPRRPLPRILLEVRHGQIYATDVELRT